MRVPSRIRVRSWALKIAKSWVRPLAVAAVVTCSFRSAIADWNDVPTGSMKPTILEGDRIFVNKLAYDLKWPFTTRHIARWADPQRGDVVVLYAPDNGMRLVKRVIGLPGDSIEMRNGRLLIHGQPASYAGLDPDIIRQLDPTERSRCAFGAEGIGRDWHPVMFTPTMPGMRSFGPITVPEGHYFVMGDNRDASRDSRYFGTVPRDQIVGKVRAVVLSVDRNHGYLPRWQRFFRSVQ